MFSRHPLRIVAVLAALFLAVGSHAQPTADPQERGEPVRSPRPTVVQVSELPESPSVKPWEEPQSHLQGEITQRVERGVELVPTRAEKPSEHDVAVPELPDPTLRSAVHVNVQAIDFQGWIPPDAVVAANSTYILAAVNDGFTVYDDAGVEVKAFNDFTNFFSGRLPAGWQGKLFDPRVAYVADEDQFVMVVLGRDEVAQSSYIFLAVSENSDPGWRWWTYRYRADKNNETDFWLDFPGLAGDKWGVYFTGNYFSEATNTFQYSGLWSITPDIYDGTAANGWKMVNITWPSTGNAAFAIQPAVPYSTAWDEATFFAATYSGSGDEVLLMKMTGDRANMPTLTKAEIPIHAYDKIGPNADQPGTSADLHAGDCRVGNAVYSQRRVYVALSTDPDNNGASGGVIVAKLDVDANTRLWQNLTRSSAATANYYFYPAVTIGSGGSTNPKIAWFGTWSSASQNPSTLYRLYDSGSGHTPVEFISTHTGVTDYENFDPNGRNRWGDYSGAAFQVGTDDMCGISQYSTSNTTWATRLVCID